MAHQRTQSIAEGGKEPHSVSLKVLRLSRPSFSIQHPLPQPTPLLSPDSASSHLLGPSPLASTAYPSAAGLSSSTGPSPFLLSPLLTLPPAFGSAYVGETFSCTLCANNELLAGGGNHGNSYTTPGSTGTGTPVIPTKTINNIAIEAEMKIPSSNVPVKLDLGPEPTSSPSDAAPSTSNSPPPSPPSSTDPKPNLPTPSIPTSTLSSTPPVTHQRTLTFPLTEEGPHILAITISYTETSTTPTSISSRHRTFRKLYQFASKPCLIVRTKSRLLPTSSPSFAPSLRKRNQVEKLKKQEEDAHAALKSDAQDGEANGRSESKSSTTPTPQPLSTPRPGPQKWVLEAQLDNVSEGPIILEAVILEPLPGVLSTSLNYELELEHSSELEKPILRTGDVYQVAFVVEEEEERDEGAMQPVDGKWLFGVLSLSWRGPMGNKGGLRTGRLGAKVK